MTIRPWFVLVLIALIVVGMSACGGGDHKSAGALTSKPSRFILPGEVATTAAGTPRAGTSPSYYHDDDDDDADAFAHEDDIETRAYGSPAAPRDSSEIALLLKRYYAAAATGDGQQACTLLAPSLARRDLVKALPEYYLPERGVSIIVKGGRCQEFMSLLFEQHHQRLAADNASLVVALARVKGTHGLAVLGFRSFPERQIAVVRQGGIWKVNSLLDSEVH